MGFMRSPQKLEGLKRNKNNMLPLRLPCVSPAPYPYLRVVFVRKIKICINIFALLDMTLPFPAIHLCGLHRFEHFLPSDNSYPPIRALVTKPLGMYNFCYHTVVDIRIWMLDFIKSCHGFMLTVFQC